MLSELKRLSWAPARLWLPLLCLSVWLVGLVSTMGQINQPFAGFRIGYCLTVSEFNEPHWNGVRAGLRSGDAVVSADGLALTPGNPLLRHARSVPVGTPVRYEVQRDGRTVALAIPTQRLTVLDFLTSFGVFYAISLLMLAIGASAFLLRPDNPAAKANFALSVGMALWFVFNNDYDMVQLFHPVLYFAATILYACAAFAMVLNFPEPPRWVKRWPVVRHAPLVMGLLLLGGVIAIFAQLGFTPAAETLAGTLSLAWATLVLLGSLITFLVRGLVTRDARQRGQLLVLLAGVSLAFLPWVVAKVVADPAAPSPMLINATYFCWVFFPLSVAYAIIKHNLFDISIIIKRTTVYAALTAFLVGGYFGTAAAIRALATGLLGTGQASDWENVLATGIIAVAFVPVRNWVTQLVDRLFFRTRYNFREVVARVTTKAQSTLDIDDMKHQFMTVIGEALHPRYMYILTMQPEGDVLTTMGLQATWGAAPVAELHVLADDPLLKRTSRDLEMDYVPGTGQTGLLSPLAALGPHYRIPLQVGEEVVGLVVLGPKRSDEAYSTEDRELLAATRLPLATALKTAAMLDDRLFKDRMDQELKRAREVQEAMLPRSLPALPGFDFAASSIPCYEASGDYYDFLELPDGRLAIAVADVAGKGIAAALATAMAKSGLYNQAQTDPEVIPVLSALNRLIHNVSKNSTAKSFTTCLYALLDPSGRKLTYAAAGHFPPLHYNAAAGRMSEFPVISGFPLGVRENSKYVSHQVALNPGDVLVFYTDGVTEAQAPEHLPPNGDVAPGEPFESERLAEIVMANKDASAQEIHAAITRAVDAFVAGGPQTDDITLVVVKLVPVPAMRPPTPQEVAP